MTKSSPFALIAFAFAAGVWFAAQFAAQFVPLWLSGAVAAVLLVVVALRRAAAPRPAQAWPAAFAMLIALGALRYTISAPVPSADSTAPYNGSTVVLEGAVVDEPDVRTTFVYLRVGVQRLVVDSAIRQPSGVVLVRAGRDVVWHYGDVVRAFGTIDAPPLLSEFDYRAYLARKGVFSWMPSPERIQRIGTSEVNPLYAGILSAKAALRLSSQQVMPSPESGLLSGILIGDDSEIPQSIQDAFRRTGTSHIVAISGFNVTIVIALVVPALSRLLNKRRAAVVAIPAIVAYTLLVGASASVVRAATMAVLALIGQLFWRRGFTLNTLCAAAFFMLVADPETLYDGGFQLSFAATLGLVLYADRITDAVQGWLERHFNRERAQKLTGVLADVLLVTLSAQITTLPLILANFRQLSLITLVTNAIVLPLQPAAMILGIVASLGGLIFAPAGTLIALPAYALLTATLRVVEWTGSLPYAAIPIYDFGAPAALAYYLGLLAFTAVASQPPQTRRTLIDLVKSRLSAGTVLLLAVILAVAGAIYWFQRPDGKLHVTFGGTGAFIQTPGGKQVVFAGGSASSGAVLPVMGRAMPLWDKGVELVLLAQRNDRARGDTLPLLQRYQVGTLILPDSAPGGVDEPTAMLAEWTDLAQAKAGRVISAPIGTRIVVEPGVVLTVEQRMLGGIGARLAYGDTTIDLAGEAMVISGTLTGADVVFASAKAAGPAVLNAAAPRWVVWADAGGTPGSGLNKDIRTILLRDLGTLEFISDGKSLTVAGP